MVARLVSSHDLEQPKHRQLLLDDIHLASVTSRKCRAGDKATFFYLFVFFSTLFPLSSFLPSLQRPHELLSATNPFLITSTFSFLFLFYELSSGTTGLRPTTTITTRPSYHLPAQAAKMTNQKTKFHDALHVYTGPWAGGQRKNQNRTAGHRGREKSGTGRINGTKWNKAQ